MEEQSSSMFELQMDDSAQTYLRDTTKWTRFIAIMFYICMGFMAFFLVIMFMFKDKVAEALAAAPKLAEFGIGTSMLVTTVGFIIILCLAVFAVITYALMRFSSQTRKGIDQQNQVALEAGISSLKNYMIISGILGILGILVGLIQLIAIF